MNNKLSKLIIIVSIFALFNMFFLVGFVLRENTNICNEYVLNTRTMKIHASSCDSVRKMSAKNKTVVKDNISNLLSKKYTICKKCKAGIRKKWFNQIIDRLLYKNLYVEIDNSLPPVKEYLSSINEMCKWYVKHIPTYASSIQEETLKKIQWEREKIHCL